MCPGKLGGVDTAGMLHLTNILAVTSSIKCPAPGPGDSGQEIVEALQQYQMLARPGEIRRRLSGVRCVDCR